jgi:hypothetical protein
LSPSPPSLDLFTASQRLAEHLAQQPVTDEGLERWFETVEIHLLAVRVLIETHTHDWNADPCRRELLWDAPRIAPLLRRMSRDCRRLEDLTTFALAAVRAKDRRASEVRHVGGELTRRIALLRSRLDGIYHEAFAVDIGGPG